VLALHSVSYAVEGFQRGFAQEANVQVNGDSIPVGFWLASLMNTRQQAANMVFDVVKTAAASPFDPVQIGCGDLIPARDVFQLAVVNGTTAMTVYYAVFAIQNVVGEVALFADANTADADILSFDRAGSQMGSAGVLQVESATGTPPAPQVPR
jgi:hypothetical protein